MGGRLVQRDLFPLQSVRASDPGSIGGGHGRCNSRRQQANDKWMSAANRGISALNQIMGFNNFCQYPPSEAQALALGEIRAAYRRHESAAASVGEPPTGGAIRELCGGSSSYTGERADLKPFAEELISWPPLGSSPVRLEDALGATDRQWLGQWQHTMLRSETDVLAAQQAKLLTQAGRCIDPVLKHNRSKYVSYIRQMQNRGMTRFKIGYPKIG